MAIGFGFGFGFGFGSYRPNLLEFSFRLSWKISSSPRAQSVLECVSVCVPVLWSLKKEVEKCLLHQQKQKSKIKHVVCLLFCLYNRKINFWEDPLVSGQGNYL